MERETRVSKWKRALVGALRLTRPKQLRANLQYLPAYWSLRKRFRLLSFYVLRTRHTLGSRVHSLRESVQILFLILHAIGGSFLLAMLLVLTSALVEFAFRRIVISTESIALHWPILAPIYRGLKTLHIDAGGASTLLGTLAQIAGIFLGLYFAVVGTLVSTRYATVAPNIRELMIADKLGNEYIRLVALFGAVATLLLAAQSLGIVFGLFNVTVVTILGVATILSFVILGRRAFEFFDPGSLADQLGSELVGWINRATRLAYFGRQPSFQAYYQKQTATLLGSYEGVVRMATLEEVGRQHTLPYLAQHALGILVYYAQRKHRIASESHWFRRQYEHKNWLTTSFTETSIALRTGTALSPKEVPDLLWFEKKVNEIFWFAYTKLLDDNSSGQVVMGSAEMTIIMTS